MRRNEAGFFPAVLTFILMYMIW